MTPKRHPELAGEGIEYIWGVVKKHLRALNLTLATSESGKHPYDNVNKPIDDLALGVVRVCAWRARSHKLAYMAIGAGADVAEYSEIKKLVNEMKQHRGCGRLERGFVKEVIAMMELEE